LNALSDQCHSVKEKEPTGNDDVSDDEARLIYSRSSFQIYTEAVCKELKLSCVKVKNVPRVLYKPKLKPNTNSI